MTNQTHDLYRIAVWDTTYGWQNIDSSALFKGTDIDDIEDLFEGSLAEATQIAQEYSEDSHGEIFGVMTNDSWTSTTPTPLVMLLNGALFGQLIEAPAIDDVHQA